MEISYNITGPRRKELATAVGDFIGTAPVYQKARRRLFQDLQKNIPPKWKAYFVSKNPLTK